jgi:2'-5' RNA ligase
VALPVPELQRRRLGAHLEDCARLAPGYRWVPAENLHLTLRFLGGLAQATLDRLQEDLRSIAGTRFRLGLDGRGTFGPRASPRVVWLAVEQGAQECRRLAEEMEAACRALGLEPEARPFRAHLTLARARPEASSLPALPDPPELEPWTVDEFVLYESRLGGRVPTYMALRRYPLGS